MIYRGEGGLGLVVGVVVEMVEMILVFWSFGHVQVCGGEPAVEKKRKRNN